jgi:hypothetical protein
LEEQQIEFVDPPIIEELLDVPNMELYDPPCIIELSELLLT